MRTIFSKKWLIVSLLVSLFSFVALPTLVSANHSWGGYHWARTSNPFALNLADNVSSSWDPFLVTTSNDWSISSVLDTTIVTGIQSPRRCRPTAGRVEVCNYRYGSNGWLGLAQIWITGDHITQGVTKLNDTYFTTTKYNTPAWKNLVMCQEVGHTFGLHHQDEIHDNPNLGTCMDYTNDPDGTLFNQLSNEHPNLHDYEMLETIYAHLDTTSTVGQTSPQGAANGDFHSRAEWGKQIRDNGYVGFYEHDFGNGNKLETFVIWAHK